MGLWAIQRERSLGLRPFFFVPGTLWRTWGTRPSSASAMTETPIEVQSIQVESCGIPHLAKTSEIWGTLSFVAGGVPRPEARIFP
jgi:hypothetical protein